MPLHRYWRIGPFRHSHRHWPTSSPWSTLLLPPDAFPLPIMIHPLNGKGPRQTWRAEAFTIKTRGTVSGLSRNIAAPMRLVIDLMKTIAIPMPPTETSYRIQFFHHRLVFPIFAPCLFPTRRFTHKIRGIASDLTTEILVPTAYKPSHRSRPHRFVTCPLWIPERATVNLADFGIHFQYPHLLNPDRYILCIDACDRRGKQNFGCEGRQGGSG